MSLDALSETVRRCVAAAGGSAGRDLAVAACLSAGFEVLGAGMSRVAVLAPSLPGSVAKVEWASRDGWLDDQPATFGYGANVTEAAVWLAAPEEVRRYLAPCEFVTAGGTLIQRRAQPLAGREDELAAAHSALRAFGIRDELDPNDWGLHGGRVVTVDYGCAEPALTRSLEADLERLAGEAARDRFAANVAAAIRLAAG